jgi:hypothetical protein
MLAGMTAGCGVSAGTVHRRPDRPQAFVGNGHLVSSDDFRSRTVEGVKFSVPPRLTSAATALIPTTAVNVSPNPPFTPRRTPPGLDASAGAVIQRPYRLEVIADGPAGRRVDVSWEESCGLYRVGTKGSATSAYVGGHGQQRARLPAIVRVMLPRWSRGQDTCYVSALLMTSHFERGLSLELANSWAVAIETATGLWPARSPGPRISDGGCPIRPAR